MPVEEAEVLLALALTAEELSMLLSKRMLTTRDHDTFKFRLRLLKSKYLHSIRSLQLVIQTNPQGSVIEIFPRYPNPYHNSQVLQTVLNAMLRYAYRTINAMLRYAYRTLIVNCTWPRCHKYGPAVSSLLFLSHCIQMSLGWARLSMSLVN
ncbi:hypothetical protein EYC84_007141 [Monilinia fructicola]|uniref:Uncharacterized protein n=1 Tax=Monilinia fructicola TaxID=38448 RepID=A0A5M9KAM2_MONFR|nr:hypothetical protein EYC84_007141 [Monilinia fructicola]